MKIYEDFLQQIKEESIPPAGAFTKKKFGDDLGVGSDRARRILKEQIDAGRVRNVGRFAHPTGSGHPCEWYIVVEQSQKG